MKNVSARKLVLISLLSALCYIVLYFKIPIPAPVGNPFLHLGNMLVLLFALLFGGMTGGIAGCVGMGMFDILNGYHLYAPKTIILKFLIGIVCGAVYILATKKMQGKMNKIIFALGTVFLLVAVSIHCVYNATEGIIYVESVDKTLSLSPLLFISAYLLALFMFIAYFFAKNKNEDYKCAIFACVCGILANIFGEFILSTGQYMIMTGTALMPSMILSAISLPATLLNGMVSIIIAVHLFHILKNKTSITSRWKNV